MQEIYWSIMKKPPLSSLPKEISGHIASFLHERGESLFFRVRRGPEASPGLLEDKKSLPPSIRREFSMAPAAAAMSDTLFDWRPSASRPREGKIEDKRFARLDSLSPIPSLEDEEEQALPAQEEVVRPVGQ